MTIGFFNRAGFFLMILSQSLVLKLSLFLLDIVLVSKIFSKGKLRSLAISTQTESLIFS